MSKNIKKKEIKTEKQALEYPLGTFHHPTKNTYRTGACDIGEILKKGYTKKINSIENNKKIKKNIYIGPVCIKDKGKPGIEINNKPESKIKENLKMQKYINDIKKKSFRSVIMSLYSQLKKKDLTPTQKTNINNDIEMLKKWRVNNPIKKNNKNIGTNDISSKSNESSKNNKASQIIESSQINSIITNFTNKLNKDFGKSKKGNNSNSIQELKNNSNLTNKSNKDFGKSKKGNNSNNSIQELKNNSNLTNKDFRKSKKGNKINNNSNSNIQELTTNEIIELIKNN
jgi:hypothetical protein